MTATRPLTTGEVIKRTPGWGYTSTMPKTRRRHCKLCGASREQAQMSKTGYCYNCSLRRVNANLHYYMTGDPSMLMAIEDEQAGRTAFASQESRFAD